MTTVMTTAIQKHQARMQRVLDYIDAHPHDNLNLDFLCSVAAYSGARCAVLRVVGNTSNLERAALYLYRDWLPASGEEAGDFPLYCQRLSLFPEVPEHEAVAELFLTLK